MRVKFHIDTKGLLYGTITMAVIVATLTVSAFAGQRIARIFRDSDQTPEYTQTDVQITADEESREQIQAHSASTSPDTYAEAIKEQPLFLANDAVIRQRGEMIGQGRDFLFADLTGMSLSLYQKGAVVATYPIAAKAEEGSFFEIPGGMYAIQAKSKSYVSRIERKSMPFALHLFSNYLIHSLSVGIKRGAPVPNNVSIGSIALPYEDAIKLFAQATEHTPVLVAGSRIASPPSFSYFKKTNLPHRVPIVQAAGAIAADIDTGEILFEKNKEDSFPIASVTKLMTAIIAHERVASSTLLTVTSGAIGTFGNSGGFIRGEVFRAEDLFYGLLLPSSNDAAHVFETTDEHFVEAMNRKAEEFGMHSTHYADSSGLSQQSSSSVSDLVRLLQRLVSNYPDILATSRVRQRVVTSGGPRKVRHIWDNINWPSDNRFIGGKAGFTDESLQTMAGVYGINASEYGGRRIAIVVLGTHTRVEDVRSIINYLENEFIYGAVLNGATTMKRPTVGFSGASIYEAAQR